MYMHTISENGKVAFGAQLFTVRIVTVSKD